MAEITYFLGAKLLFYIPLLLFALSFELETTVWLWGRNGFDGDKEA
jgi:hypothetical protein